MGGLAVAVAIRYVKLFADFYKFDQVGTIWLISTAVCDTAIAISLTWHLVSLTQRCRLSWELVLMEEQKRHKTGFSSTDDVLNRIIRRAYSVFSKRHFTDSFQLPFQTAQLLPFGQS